MKRIIALLVVFAMAFSLVGCTTGTGGTGADDKEPQGTDDSVVSSTVTGGGEIEGATASDSKTARIINDPNKPAGTGRTIALQVTTMAQMFFQMIIMGAQDALRDGDNLVVYSMETDAEKQLTQVETMIANGVDAIILNPLDADACVMSAKKAFEAGIPVIVQDNEIAEPEWVVTQNIGNNYMLGYYGGKAMCEGYYEKHGNYNGKIMLACMESVEAGRQRIEGFKDALAEFGPEMEIVCVVDESPTTADNLGPIENMLTAHPEIDCFWSWCDPPCIAGVQVFDQAGVLDDMVITTVECSSWVAEMIQEGIIYSGLDTCPYSFGYNSMDYVYAYLDGETLEEVYYGPLIPTYKENLDEAITWRIENEIAENGFDIDYNT